jgi:hypothetical protein
LKSMDLLNSARFSRVYPNSPLKNQASILRNFDKVKHALLKRTSQRAFKGFAMNYLFEKAGISTPDFSSMSVTRFECVTYTL